MSDPFFEMYGFSLYDKAETEAKSFRKRSSTQANSGETHQGGEFPKPARVSRTPVGKKARAVGSDEDLRFTFKNKNKTEDAETEDAEAEDA
ncbi:hypothetical protein LQW54_006366 [Pestalotiopsis sp. IQ-011]